MSRTTNRGRRAKRFNLTVLSTRLTVSLRYFRTDKAKRSKVRSQLVVPVYLLPVKEVAIVKNRARKYKKAKKFQFQPQLPLILILLGVIGIGYFSLNLFVQPKLYALAPTKTAQPVVSTTPKPTSKYLSHSVPTSLRVPSLEINSSLVAVGRNADNNLQVPSDASMAGWYADSPTPGEKGPTIIVGHVDSLHGIGVFWRLRELQPGDTIAVDRADGSTAKFKVDSLKQYPKDELPTTEIYGNIDHAGIRLITCGGIFDTQTQHYTHTTVVFGTLIN